MKLKAGLLLNTSLRICPLTFINEALHLSISPFVAITASPYVVLFGRHSPCAVLIWPRPSIILATSILRAGKSHETCLTNRTRPITHHIMPMVINALGADTQTHEYRHANQSNFTKLGAHSLRLQVWFKNCKLNNNFRGVARISQRGVLNSADSFSADKNSSRFGYFQLYTPYIVSLVTLYCKNKH